MANKSTAFIEATESSFSQKKTGKCGAMAYFRLISAPTMKTTAVAINQTVEHLILLRYLVFLFF